MSDNVQGHAFLFASVVELCDRLQENKTLTSLNLRGNEFEEEKVQACLNTFLETAKKMCSAPDDLEHPGNGAALVDIGLSCRAYNAGELKNKDLMIAFSDYMMKVLKDSKKKGKKKKK